MPHRRRVFLAPTFKDNYRTLIESTFTVWPSIVPDTVAVALLLSGLPFRAVDALALPDASSLYTLPSDVWMANDVPFLRS